MDRQEVFGRFARNVTERRWPFSGSRDTATDGRWVINEALNTKKQRVRKDPWLSLRKELNSRYAPG
jgi:hypothetical protein